MQIITISREFGSGGREIGKRMADLLQVAYYDKEIVTAVAEKSQLAESYVSEIMEKGLARSFPLTIGRTLAYPSIVNQNAMKILVARQKIIKELAQQGNCIIMGQSADVILQEHNPLNLFVYADMDAKIKRCMERAPEGETLTAKELKKKIKQVDAERSKQRDLLTDGKWGRKENYHLCVNTTGLPIKTLAAQIAGYAKFWFEVQRL